MDPLTLSLIASLAPGLLSKLFGGDPAKKYQRQVGKLTSPGNVAALTNQFYQQGLGSPMFSQAQGQIAAGANQAANNVAASLAARGVGTSGSAAVLSGLTPSLVGSQQANLRGAVYQGAQGQAQNQIQQLLDALGKGYGQPSQSSQLFAGGLDALGPLLQHLLSGGGGGGLPTGSLIGASNYTPPLPTFRPRAV